MEWIENKNAIPIKSWCSDPGEKAMEQARNLADHPRCYGHIALMPDCHPGYGMPIGGVIACDNALIPYAVGVDIGCGMVAVETGMPEEQLKDKKLLEKLFNLFRDGVPAGEGHSHRYKQKWPELENFCREFQPPWSDSDKLERDLKNLGTLGGGNHFLEIQRNEQGRIWLMVHTGSRNLGYRIADWHHKIASNQNNLGELSWLESDSPEGIAYARDMKLAMSYAQENRSRIMTVFKEILDRVYGPIDFGEEVNIHHNYASREKIEGKDLWIHRKGATSAAQGQKGIVPGSMGTCSYIVEGKGNMDSFQSCSHGAGRVMSRNEAIKTLTVEQCEKAMRGIFHTPWKKSRKKGKPDLSEAPQAYKNIESVMDSQKDLITPLVRLIPLAVLKG